MPGCCKGRHFCCCNWNERATFWRARLVLNSTSGWYLIEPSAHWVRCAGNPIHRLPFVSNSWQLWMINPDGKVTNRNPRRLPSGRGFQFETVIVRCPPLAPAGFAFVDIVLYPLSTSSVWISFRMSSTRMLLSWGRA